MFGLLRPIFVESFPSDLTIPFFGFCPLQQMPAKAWSERRKVGLEPKGPKELANSGGAIQLLGVHVVGNGDEKGNVQQQQQQIQLLKS